MPLYDTKMLNLNRVVLTGRLVRDPELRHTSDCIAVCNVTIVNNRRYREDNGELKDEAIFINVTFWRKSAIKLVEFFKKSDPIFVEGRLTLSQWVDKAGNPKQNIEIAGNEWRFLQPTYKNDGELGEDEYWEYEVVEVTEET